MNKSLYLIALFILTMSLLAKAQETEYPAPDEDQYITYGPDQKNFWHLYLGFGGFADSGEPGAEINSWKSSEFKFGMRFKRKLSSVLSLGTDLGMSNHHFALKQDGEKTVPNNSLNDREKFIFNNLGLEFYLRINLTNPEQKMGTFFDLGAFGNWSYRIRHEIRNDAADSEYQERIIVTNRRLKYTEPLHAGLRGRLGFNRVALMAEYRLTRLFKEEYDFPELPALVISLQLGLH